MSLDAAATVPVVIIGGGISGLSLAYFLKEAGVQTLVLEEKVKAGGLMQTYSADDFLAESGPNSFSLPWQADSPHALSALIQNLDLRDELTTARPLHKHRYIWRGTQLHAVPMHPLQLLRSRLLSGTAKWCVFTEAWRRRQAPLHEESLADFTRRRFNQEILDYILNPLATGIYAGDPQSLSVASAFPQLKQLEDEHGSVVGGALKALLNKNRQRPLLQTFRGGMGVLTQKLATKLGGKHLWCGTRVERIRRLTHSYAIEVMRRKQPMKIKARHLVIATNLNNAAHLAKPLAADLAQILKDFPTSSIASLTLGFSRKQFKKSLQGFGFLVPQCEALQLLGVIFNSSLFPARAPAGYATLTCMLGGSRNPELVEADEEEIIKRVRKELFTTLGVSANPSFKKLYRWPQTIPQYQVGHHQRMMEFAATLKRLPRLYFTGNYIDGISVPHLVERSQKLSQTLATAIRSDAWNKLSSSVRVQQV